MHVGEELTGINLEQLGYEPRPERLLDETETVVEFYDLDVPEYWREQLEDMMVEDFDYDMLCDRSLDGFEDDRQFLDRFRITPMRFDDRFKPFHDQYSVPPYVQD